jgi:hypothetical protein
MKRAWSLRRTGVAGLVSALVVAAGLAAFGPGAPQALADVGEPSLIKYRPASDPELHRCGDGATRFSGLCLYTSNDLGINKPVYPMDKTYLYTLRDGQDPSNPDNWQDRGVVLDESQYYTGVPNGFVPQGAQHLWAPTHFAWKDVNYLLVPDISDAADPHTSSKIGISTSTSPFGPFAYQKTYTVPTSSVNKGYASDPAFVTSADGKPYLVFANGDNDNCGGLSIAALSSSDPTKGSFISSLLPTEIKISNGNGSLKDVFGDCGKGRPYLEGPSLYYFDQDKTGAGRGLYYLIFALKPIGGTHGDSNSVIAYATSTTINGTYAYGGIIMDASTTEWTNQASIAPWGDGFIMAYHDGTPITCGDAACPVRRTHAACLNFWQGSILPVARANTGLNRCVARGSISLESAVNGRVVVAENGGTGAVTASSPNLGLWERFDIIGRLNGKIALRSQASGRFVSANHTRHQLIADATGISSTEEFDLRTAPAGTSGYELYDYSGALVRIGPSGELVGDDQNASTWSRFFLTRFPSVIALWSPANKQYVTTELNDGSAQLTANRGGIGAWEQYYLVDRPGGFVSLVANANGRYVSAENFGNNPLAADRDLIGDWETFFVLWNSNGTFSFKANANGRFVSIRSGPRLIADQDQNTTSSETFDPIPLI